MADRPSRRDPASRRRILRFGVVCLAAVFGCSDAKIDSTFRAILEPPKTPQQYGLIAVSDSDPDARRSAVAKVADSDESRSDWAIKIFTAIALLDDDPQTRGVAIRSLGQIGGPAGTEPLLKILNHADHPPQEVRPPDALCRWDATAALAEVAATGMPETSLDTAVSTFARLLAKDTDRNTRAAAAYGLGWLQRRESLEALIEGLSDEEFIVAYECESALMRLTGRTHRYSAFAWQEWYESNQSAPFAHAGELADARTPPYSNRWEKFTYKTGQFFRWMFPGPKPN